MVLLTYLGHACFLLSKGDSALVIDPFLTGNPRAAARAEDVRVQHVLVTHGHGDHVGDAVAIARRNDATIVCTYELGAELEGQGARTHKMHIGGRHAFPFGHVRLTPALHGAGTAGGCAAGFIVNFHGVAVYHAGDTGLFSDMKLLAEIEPVRVAMLPIGDNYTMGPGDAVRAAAFLRASLVVPMHYGTFPVIEQDPGAFKERVEREVPGTAVAVLAPGAGIDL